MKHEMKHTPETWDLEEIPYEANDPVGGWYLHFDPTDEFTEDVLYMSKAHVTPERAHLIAAAPEMYRALEYLVRTFEGWLGSNNPARAALAKAHGEEEEESSAALQRNKTRIDDEKPRLR